MWKRGSKGKVLPLVLQWSLENCSKDLPVLPQSLLASLSVCPCYAALHAPPTASVPSSTPMQCMLGTLITPFSIHSLNESKHWAHSSLLFTWLSQDLPRNIPEDFFGYTFLSWWEVSCPSTCPLKLTLHLAHETARSLTNLQESLDFLAKTIPDNRLTLVHLLTEQGEVCATANTFCCTYINTSFQAKISIEEIWQQATWLHQTINH